MNNKGKTRTLNVLNYVNLILQSIPEQQFNEFITENHSRFNSYPICSCLLALLNDLEDNKALDRVDMDNICRYLKTDPDQSFQQLNRLVVDRATENQKALTLPETQRLLQAITYLVDINEPAMRNNKIGTTIHSLRGLTDFILGYGPGLSVVEPLLQ